MSLLGDAFAHFGRNLATQVPSHRRHTNTPRFSTHSGSVLTEKDLQRADVDRAANSVGVRDFDAERAAPAVAGGRLGELQGVEER